MGRNIDIKSGLLYNTTEFAKYHMNHPKVKKYILRENLRSGDLRDMIDELIEIDRYKSKMDTDADTVVVAFKAASQDAATDLGAYLEWSINSIDDVEVSDASDPDGKFHVYIELQRAAGLCQKIIDIVNDISKTTDKQEWKFIGMDGERADLNIGELTAVVIQDPKIYALPPESREWYIRMKNLAKY